MIRFCTLYSHQHCGGRKLVHVCFGFYIALYNFPVLLWWLLLKTGLCIIKKKFNLILGTAYQERQCLHWIALLLPTSHGQSSKKLGQSEEIVTSLVNKTLTSQRKPLFNSLENNSLLSFLSALARRYLMPYLASPVGSLLPASSKRWMIWSWKIRIIRVSEVKFTVCRERETPTPSAQPLAYLPMFTIELHLRLCYLAETFTYPKELWPYQHKQLQSRKSILLIMTQEGKKIKLENPL